MKGPLPAILALVAGIVVSVFLQQKAEAIRFSDRQSDVGESYLKRSKSFTMGLDSFWADFIWMKTNLSRQPKMDKNMSQADREALRIRLAKRDLAGYHKVVQLDPTFYKAYNFGILRVRTELPEKAIDLAELGMVYCKEEKRALAEMAGHIAALVRKDYTQALKYYGICVEGGPEKDYLGRQYLRTHLRLKNIDPYDKSFDGMATRIKTYHQIHLDMVSSQMGEMEGVEGEDGMSAEIHEEDYSDSWISELNLSRIRSFMNRALETDPAPSKRMVNEIRNIYKAYAPPGHHCPRCYESYDPGDKFCTNCGFELVPYGICEQCDALMKGKFCHVCGLKGGKLANK